MVPMRRRSSVRTVTLHLSRRQHQGEFDARQSVASDLETEADLQEIKAKTMYRMVEDITLGSGSRHKVLYLSNKQARLLAHTPGSMKRVLEAFEIPTPKLVIRLIQSTGGVDWTRSRLRAGINLQYPYPGGEEEALQAERNLYHFMEEVLLPLAAETNALILVQATVGSCMLTSALGQALDLHRNRFGDKPPFAVTALTSDFDKLYNNQNPSAKWWDFAKAVSSWRRRHRGILQDFFTRHPGRDSIAYDMTDAFSQYIVCDGVNEHDGRMDFNPFTAFNSSLLQHLMQQVPCIAIRTGHTDLLEGDEASLGNIVACLESGCPTIMVNLRAWPNSLMLPDVQQTYQEFLDTLGGRWDYLDCMVICLIMRAWENSRKALEQKLVEQQVPSVRRTRQSAEDLSMIAVMAEAPFRNQLAELLQWYSRLFTEAQDEAVGSSGEQRLSVDRQHQRALQMSAVIRNEHLHVADAFDIEGIWRLIRELVRLDRLPKQEEPEGIDLLEQAWCEYDAKNYLAGVYKVYSKFSYVGLLLLSALTVALTVLPDEWFGSIQVDEQGIVFIVTLMAGAATTLTTIMNPTQRWRVLRSKSAFLLSTIWRYRTRTKEFSSWNAGQKPRQTFCQRFIQWKAELAEGTNLLESTMEKAYPAWVYKHLRSITSKGHASAADADDDDFYTPVPPGKYVLCRLQPAIDFYQSRIPWMARRRRLLQVCVIACSLCSSILSHFKQGTWIPLVASLYSSLCAWQEFAGLDQKLRRYTEAVQALKGVLSWWVSLTEVERASPVCINRLVESVEDALTREVGIWASTLATAEQKASQGPEEKKEPKKKDSE
ncbi:unnamed protein product [Symbiodinium sp. CCMP2592]|nr:unnamed protein product [Symbiodinium sp. CCMP2592]